LSGSGTPTTATSTRKRRSNVSEINRPQVRAQAIRTLEMLAERYPNQRLGQLLSNAITEGMFYYIEDEDLCRALLQLQITFSQFEAARIKP
jgi:hypothetical protein